MGSLLIQKSFVCCVCFGRQQKVAREQRANRANKVKRHQECACEVRSREVSSAQRQVANTVQQKEAGSGWDEVTQDG